MGKNYILSRLSGTTQKYITQKFSALISCHSIGKTPKVVSTHPFGRLLASPFGVFRLCSIVLLFSIKQQTAFIYATEADVLNMSLFGKTAKQWREQNPKEKAVCCLVNA
jgi:hypothetical protein